MAKKSLQDEQQQDGWQEYSKLVLAELLRLGESDEKMKETILESNAKIHEMLADINLKFAKLEPFEKDVANLQKWKTDMDNVATANVLKEIKQDVASLKTFKTVAVTVWAVIQIAFGIIIAIYYK